MVSVALAVGFGLSCGCTSLCDHPLFRRGGCGCEGTTAASVPGCPCAGAPGCGCAELVPGCPSCGQGGVPAYSDGPMLEGAMPAPGYGAVIAPPVPQGTVPPLAPAPRLVPQPQAPVAPYTPTMRELR
jgi:hypothetical protein